VRLQLHQRVIAARKKASWSFGRHAISSPFSFKPLDRLGRYPKELNVFHGNQSQGSAKRRH
jgi:hypothetical protein